MSALRVASFNLKDFFEPRGAHEEAVAAQKLAHVADRIAAADAHVVALQEVGSERLLAEALDRAWGTGAREIVLGPADRRGIRNAIATRAPLVASEVHRAEALPFPRLFADDHEPFAARIPMRRGVVRARVEVAGLGTVDVLTIHFKSRLGAPMKTAEGEALHDPSPLGRGEAALRSLVQRSAEALFTRRIVDAIYAEDPAAHVCVLGDFNDTVDSVPTQIVRAATGRTPGDAHELHASHTRVEPARRFSILHGGTPDLIDHVLLSRGLHARLARAWIANEALRDHGPHEPDGPLEPDSDHALVAVEIDAR